MHRVRCELSHATAIEIGGGRARGESSRSTVVDSQGDGSSCTAGDMWLLLNSMTLGTLRNRHNSVNDRRMEVGAKSRRRLLERRSRTDWVEVRSFGYSSLSWLTRAATPTHRTRYRSCAPLRRACLPQQRPDSAPPRVPPPIFPLLFSVLIGGYRGAFLWRERAKVLFSFRSDSCTLGWRLFSTFEFSARHHTG